MIDQSNSVPHIGLDLSRSCEFDTVTILNVGQYARNARICVIYTRICVIHIVRFWGRAQKAPRGMSLGRGCPLHPLSTEGGWGEAVPPSQENF